MKKYLLGLIAIAFAIVGNSFTIDKKANTEYYWYDDELTPLFGGEKTDELPAGCSVGATPLCAYGHEEEIHTPGVNESIKVKFD
jgi:hypothetical protein